MTYSLDFRRKVLSVREKEGLSIKEVAKRFDIGAASVMRWVKKVVPQTTRHKPATKINMQALAQDVREHPDSYVYERERRFTVSPTCIRKALKRLGVTYKKTLQHPKVSLEAPIAFQKWLQSHQKKNRPIVFVDESGFAVDMPRTHGYSLRGQRCWGRHDWGARGRVNVIGALLGSALLTVCLFEQTINTNVFESWIEQDLLPSRPLRSQF